MTTDTAPPKLMYTVETLAVAAELSPSAIRKEIAAGTIIAKKYGSKTLIPVSEGKRFCESLPDSESRRRAS